MDMQTKNDLRQTDDWDIGLARCRQGDWDIGLARSLWGCEAVPGFQMMGDGTRKITNPTLGSRIQRIQI